MAMSVLALLLWAGPAAAVSATEFGAMGDGRADDTRAIQAALDSGKSVVVPEGVFRITNALQPRENQQIEIIGTIKVADAVIQPLAADVPAGHDRNILLRLSEACHVAGNRSMDSQFEDGIIVYSGNRHCVVQGNICSGNARMGICVSAFQTGILLSGNICMNNPLNFSIRGDHGSSTGDFSSGGRVNVEGRGNIISGLISLGSVSISATDLVYNGGTVGGEEGKILAVAMSIARNSPDYRVAPVDRVRIRGVTFRGCTTAMRVSGVVKDVRLLDNRFLSEGPAVVVAEECRAEVSLARNDGFATETAAPRPCPAQPEKSPWPTACRSRRGSRTSRSRRPVPWARPPASGSATSRRRASTSWWMPNRATPGPNLHGESWSASR
jgi:hypothetical protein